MRVIVTAIALFAFAACKEKPSSPEPEKPKTAERKKKGRTAEAEVEFFGTWAAGDVKAAKVIFVTQAEPCTPVPEKPTRYGEQMLEQPGPLFAEFFSPQGTVGHGCVYGLDEAGKVVGVSGSDQNPMRFEGQGEVVFGKLEYALKAP
jgi:hypothetical protein